MSNFVIGYQNAVLSGTVASSSNVAGMGPDQLQNDQGNSASALQIPATSGTITLTFAGYFRAFGLFRTNLTGAAVVTFAVMNGGSMVYSGSADAVQSGFGQAVHIAAGTYAGTSVVVTISDPTNPDGFLNIPLMYAGDALQPARNYDYQSVPGRTHQSTSAMTRAGGAILRTDWIKRTFDLSLSSVRPDEVLSIQELDLAARQGNNILLVPDPDAAAIARDTVFGQFEPSSGITYSTQSGRVRGYRGTLTERL